MRRQAEERRRRAEGLHREAQQLRKRAEDLLRAGKRGDARELMERAARVEAEAAESAGPGRAEGAMRELMHNQERLAQQVRELHEVVGHLREQVGALREELEEVKGALRAARQRAPRER